MTSHTGAALRALLADRGRPGPPPTGAPGLYVVFGLFVDPTEPSIVDCDGNEWQELTADCGLSDETSGALGPYITRHAPLLPEAQPEAPADDPCPFQRLQQRLAESERSMGVACAECGAERIAIDHVCPTVLDRLEAAGDGWGGERC